MSRWIIVFTYGLLFIIANGLYLLFSMLVGISIYFLLRKKWWIDGLNILNPLMRWKGLISTIAFLVVLLAPFYDLIIQMGIKSYYQNYKMNDTIYAYPEKNENGKVESLNNITSTKYLDGYLVEGYSHERFIKSFKNVEKFVEVKIHLISDENGKYIGELGEKLIRIDLTKEHNPYIEISKDESKARYIVEVNENALDGFESKPFNIYQEKVFIFKDIKKDQILATAWRLKFTKNANNFRSKFLFWRSANGMPIGVDFISNDKAISEKVFGFDYRINVSKLRG